MEYTAAEQLWARVWAQVAEDDRLRGGWRAPWFKPQPPNDGNPIFSAISESQRKAIRVIQYEPTSEDEEFDYWFDTFGGEATDADSIRELVIACALSVESAEAAGKLISSWVRGVLTDCATTGISTDANARHP
ncbi:MAG TPA: hypothetical protein VFI31_26070 [Pirellulales bacterium]|nr:hypothetical protein [Pirellulales bacterium]